MTDFILKHQSPYRKSERDTEEHKVWLGSLAVSHTLASPEIPLLYPNKGTATAIVSSLDLEIIASLYMLRNNIYYLSAFLAKNPHLVSILIDAYRHIKIFFPRSNIFLEISAEPEEYGVEQATLSITTDLTPDDAIDMLTQFDRTWWLNAQRQVVGKLCITLEFQ